MTLKTSFFDKTIFAKTVKRFWPLWLAYLALWLLLLPVSLHENYQWTADITVAKVQRYIFDMCTASVIVAFIAAPIVAMAVFSHLYNDRSCGAYASLPVKRESMFVSVMLAGLVPMLLSILLTFFATLTVEHALGCVEWTAALSWLAVACMNTITFYGFAVLCAQMTGHALILPAVYLVLSFTAIVVNAIVGSLCEMFLYGFTNYESTFAMWLTPVVKLVSRTSYAQQDVYVTAEGYTRAASYKFTGWDETIAYCISGLVFLAVSLFLYRGRRMEAAGDVVAIRKLRPVFKYALAGGCALVLGMIAAGLFYNNTHETVFGMPLAAGLGVFLLAGGFVGYFGAEMLNRKTFRVFGSKNAWLGYVCFAAVAVMGLCTLVFDLTGFETRVPKVENIKAVSVSHSGENVLCEGDDVLAAITLHKKMVATKNASDPLKEDWNGRRWFRIFYTTKDGRLISREYDVPLCDKTMDFYRDAEDFFNSPLARKNRGFTEKNLNPQWFEYCTVNVASEGGKQIALTQQEACDFYKTCVEPDLLEGKLCRVWILEDSVYKEAQYYNVHIEMNVRSPYTDEYGNSIGYDHLYFQPTTESARINAWLKGRGVELKLPDKTEYDEKYGYGSVTSFPEMSSAEILQEIAREAVSSSF